MVGFGSDADVVTVVVWVPLGSKGTDSVCAAIWCELVERDEGIRDSDV